MSERGAKGGVEEGGPVVLRTSRGPIVGKNRWIREALAVVERVAPSSCSVVVTGESGTGKELIVAALHDASPRRDAPLVAVNCGAIPDHLVESELFGHVRGAFTGATSTRKGLVAAAEGGTLFLDEVGELPLGMQVKLLRLVQQREYIPVGSSTTATPADVRIVAATNRDLEVEVREGRFREDLFYRLNVIQVSLPPLRERPEDIPFLVQHFFEQSRERAGRIDLAGVASEAMDLMVAYPWPGNVRALENTIERAVLLARGPCVELADLPPQLAAGATQQEARPPLGTLPEDGVDLKEVVAAYENALIQQALDRTSNNKNKAAQLLGIRRTTLVEMMKRKGIHRS